MTLYADDDPPCLQRQGDVALPGAQRGGGGVEAALGGGPGNIVNIVIIYCVLSLFYPPLPGAEEPLLLGPEQRHHQGLLLVPGPGPQVSADQHLVNCPSDLCVDCLKRFERHFLQRVQIAGMRFTIFVIYQRMLRHQAAPE